MCGIYGQFNPRGADINLIERMAVCLAHRGPDGDGAYRQGALAFGAGRLAIIDLAAPAGPIFSEDRRVAVAYNGEIYNYQTLRAELERLGHRFATRTDTEVIVHGYESWGKQVIERLRGMFALCLWDEREERLLLARDRLGEKPLYYTRIGDEFLFASEIKALLEHPGVRCAVSHEALQYYLLLGYTPPPLTLFDGIHKLAPGELLVVSRRELEKERYWQPVMDTSSPPDYAEAVRQVRQALAQAVEMRLMSDVPIGAFLSGGVDSTAVVALMSRALGRPVETFTVGFDFPSGSDADRKFNVDAHYAALAAAHLGAHHHAITIRQDDAVRALFPHLVYAMDEPVSQHAVIQTAYVSALARLHGVPVLLTGDAGDELFLGYYHYRSDQVLARYLRIPRLLRQAVLTPLLERARSDKMRKLGQKSRHADPVRRYLDWMRMFAPEDLPELLCDATLANNAFHTVSGRLRPLLEAPRTRRFADRIAFTSLNLWVAEDSNMRVDKMSMMMSTEARAPFQDHLLVELALRLPLEYKLRRGDFKVVLKEAVADLLPPEILNRPKWGFAPPSSDWLRTILKPLVDTYLSPEYVAATGFFRPEEVARLVDEHMTKRSYQLWPLWTLLVFQLWHALYIDRSLILRDKITPAALLPESEPAMM